METLPNEPASDCFIISSTQVFIITFDPIIHKKNLPRSPATIEERGNYTTIESVRLTDSLLNAFISFSPGL